MYCGGGGLALKAPAVGLILHPQAGLYPRRLGEPIVVFSIFRVPAPPPTFAPSLPLPR